MNEESLFNASFSRRVALKRVIGLSVAFAALQMPAFGRTPGVASIGTDPNLLAKDIPWKLQLTPAEKRTVIALCDIIIPADEYGPAASKVGVPEFVDEWVSAPYDAQKADLEIVRKGLAWFDTESQTRFKKGFADASVDQQKALLDDTVKEGTPAREQGFGYFSRLRWLITGGYYTTPDGWKAIGYVGNVPMAEFPGPPPEVMKYLGL